MQEVSLLANWQEFYVLIGTAATTLTGLMFIVITLIANTSPARVHRSENTVGAFGTPTVVHLCLTLLIAGAMCAPWPVFWLACLPGVLVGLGGLIYMVIVLRRALRQAEYKPVLEDWIWHIILPMLAYTVIGALAALLPWAALPALFGLAGGLVLFLLIGIHNAWDTVTYLTITQVTSDQSEQEESQHA